MQWDVLVVVLLMLLVLDFIMLEERLKGVNMAFAARFLTNKMAARNRISTSSLGNHSLRLVSVSFIQVCFQRQNEFGFS